MTGTSSDRIEREVELAASPTRVWRALTDAREFGRWFGVDLGGSFEAGRETSGHITYPGYEHLVMRVVVREMEAERLFSFAWHPYAVDPAVDYSSEAPTLVEFRLGAAGAGTRLGVVESGFDRIPAARRDEAFRMNSEGWTGQMENIAAYLRENA
jgi:uncharacterized protein YndB with AHSA1/START domain